MNIKLIEITILFSLCILSGCATIFSWEDEENTMNNVESVTTEQATRNDYNQYSPSVAASAKFGDEYRNILLANQYQQALLTGQEKNNQNKKLILDQNINYYVRGLMQDLVGNLQYVNSSTPVAVTSFVLLDGDYNQTNLLGNQIAESLIHEVHKFGIPVLDYKTTDYIMVTPEGDYTFSKDYTELKPGLPIRYVVSGTLVKHQGGYLVNARIIGVESKAVVASAQSFIPEDVTNAIMGELSTEVQSSKVSIQITQGE